MTWQTELELLEAAGVTLGPGLTEEELIRVESVVEVSLPADLRSLLYEALPLGQRFPNWREPTSEAIRKQPDQILDRASRR
jgi:cell wall assembly regulator SMI1